MISMYSIANTQRRFWRLGKPKFTHQHLRNAQDARGNLDVPVTGTEGRVRPPAGVAEYLQGPTLVPGRRCTRDALRAAFVANKDVERGRAK